MIAFLLWSLCAVIFLGIGITSRRSTQPVGFFANVKSPDAKEISDVPAYNHAVSRMWIISSILLELLGLPFLFFGQNSPVFIITYLGTVFLCMGMMIRYTFIESAYKAKK